MKVSLNWIKDYVNLDDIPVNEITARLTMIGLEVENVFNQQDLYKDFIIASVKEKKKHPNADKLSVCIVWTGEKELQVICGAPNVEQGQKVIFAPIGTVIPNGNFVINKAKIRGIESYGMICSEAELELGDDHSGIMVLDPALKEGASITSIMGFNDVIMEIAITPNRPDALSHIGIARDLASSFNRELRMPGIISANKTSGSNAEIEIKDVVNCPRYTGIVIKNIKVSESPEWLKQRLSNVGMRPINNIVDITNYIMLETGQPLHAFDLERLSGKKIIVKSTSVETEFITLDSKKRKLPAGTLMICDAERDVAVAGVMGGENSEVNSETKNLLLESAYFSSSSIRKTSRLLGLSTEASYRFERGTDPSGTLFAALRAAEILTELSGGEVNDIIDVYPEPVSPKQITLRLERIYKVLGYKISASEVKQIVISLGMQITDKNESEMKLLIPAFRPDLEREIDIIEEIARIYGFDNIPVIPKITVTLGEKTDESAFIDNLKNVAAALGFYEMINNPLQKEKTATILGSKIPLSNPLSQDMAYLRTSLIPGALETIAHNINIGEKDLKLFEIGNIFNRNIDTIIKGFEDFTEETRLLFCMTGRSSQKSWHNQEEIFDFYSIKGIISSFLSKILLDNVLNDLYYDNGNTLFDLYFQKMYEKSIAGDGGRIRRDLLKEFNIDQDVFCFEFNLNLIAGIPVIRNKYKEPLKYPKISRDLAFIFDKRVKYEEVAEFIKKQGSDLLKSVELFDIFESDVLGQGKKSMAFNLEFFDQARTLTEDEVEKDFNNIIKKISEHFNAVLRGN